MERSTIFHGKINYFILAIFNSYVKLPEGSYQMHLNPLSRLFHLELGKLSPCTNHFLNHIFHWRPAPDTVIAWQVHLSLESDAVRLRRLHWHHR